MLLIQKSILEIDRFQRLVRVQQRRGGGVAVAQKHVVQPLGDDDVDVHQVSNARENRLEVVFFGLTTNQEVQSTVHVHAFPLLFARGVHLILRGVEREGEDALGADDLFRLGLVASRPRSEFLQVRALTVADVDDLGASNVSKTKVFAGIGGVARTRPDAFAIEHEDDVVHAQLIPLCAHIWARRLEVYGHLDGDARRFRLTHVRFAHVDDRDAVRRNLDGHARPTVEARSGTARIGDGLHALQDVR